MGQPQTFDFELVRNASVFTTAGAVSNTWLCHPGTPAQRVGLRLRLGNKTYKSTPTKYARHTNQNQSTVDLGGAYPHSTTLIVQPFFRTVLHGRRSRRADYARPAPSGSTRITCFSQDRFAAKSSKCCEYSNTKTQELHPPPHMKIWYALLFTAPSCAQYIRGGFCRTTACTASDRWSLTGFSKPLACPCAERSSRAALPDPGTLRRRIVYGKGNVPQKHQVLDDNERLAPPGNRSG